MFISRANRRGSTCFSFSHISRSGMSSFERYGRYSFISGVCKYSVMAHDNTVIPNPACIKQYAISWPAYLYYWEAKYGSLCTGMRWSFCPSKRMISHAGHHHMAKFSGKCLCIHAIFTANTTFGLALRLNCLDFKYLNMSLKMLESWLALMVCSQTCLSTIWSLNSFTVNSGDTFKEEPRGTSSSSSRCSVSVNSKKNNINKNLWKA